MLEFFKIAKLPTTQKLKKVIKLLERLEFSIRNNTPNELLSPFYLKQLISTISCDISISLCGSWAKFFETFETIESQKLFTERLKLINETRHFLYTLTGETPSEWDLILPEADKSEASKYRTIFKNVFLYAEDIRSPFNLGSIFRTADAFGVEKVFLSPNCVSEENARAKRSAMGAIEYIPYERTSISELLSTLPKDFPVLALETGGTSIESFNFPDYGILLLGSEELGLSSDTLSFATSHITIPMYGIKASINVGVAFGICMQAWVSKLSSKKQ